MKQMNQCAFSMFRYAKHRPAGVRTSLRYLLLEITERLDYSELNAAYDRLPREKEATQKQMFQLVILGFMEGVTST